MFTFFSTKGRQGKDSYYEITVAGIATFCPKIMMPFFGLNRLGHDFNKKPGNLYPELSISLIKVVFWKRYLVN